MEGRTRIGGGAGGGKHSADDLVHLTELRGHGGVARAKGVPYVVDPEEVRNLLRRRQRKRKHANQYR